MRPIVTHRVGQNKCGHRLVTIILSNMDRFKKITGKFLCKFVVKRILKQAINDELQGSVATYLRCDEVVNDQTKRGLLLSL